MNRDPMRERREHNARIADVDREIAEEARERATFTTDIAKAIEPPSPFIVDAGPYTSRRDRDAIQAEQDRWTRLERLGR